MATPDPIVIVGAARTPMGGFQGDFKDAAGAGARRAPRSRPRSSAPGIAADDVEEVIMGCVLAGGPGPGAGAPGRARRGPAEVDAAHDDQQDVRLGHEGGDARA